MYWTYIDFFIAYPLQFAICNLFFIIIIIIYLFRTHSIARLLNRMLVGFLDSLHPCKFYKQM